MSLTGLFGIVMNMSSTTSCILILAAFTTQPHATLAVADKEMPGFGEQMRQISLKFVPTAILSRQVAVIRKGAQKSVVTLELASGVKITKTTQIKKKGTGTSTELEITDPQGNIIPAPQTYVQRLSEAIAVDPGLRHRGTGRKLLDAHIHRLRRRGVAALFLLALLTLLLFALRLLLLALRGLARHRELALLVIQRSQFGVGTRPITRIAQVVLTR